MFIRIIWASWTLRFSVSLSLSLPRHGSHWGSMIYNLRCWNFQQIKRIIIWNVFDVLFDASQASRNALLAARQIFAYNSTKCTSVGVEMRKIVEWDMSVSIIASLSINFYYCKHHHRLFWRSGIHQEAHDGHTFFSPSSSPTNEILFCHFNEHDHNNIHRVQSAVKSEVEGKEREREREKHRVAKPDELSRRQNCRQNDNKSAKIINSRENFLKLLVWFILESGTRWIALESEFLDCRIRTWTIVLRNYLEFLSSDHYGKRNKYTRYRWLNLKVDQDIVGIEPTQN